MMEQQRIEAFRCCQIADEERNWARPLGQCVAQRKGMIDRYRAFNIVFDLPHGLIDRSLQPENPRKRYSCRHALIELKANDIRTPIGANIFAKHALDMLARGGLISKK